MDSARWPGVPRPRPPTAQRPRQWSGIFGLLVGGGIGIALATVLCGRLALLIKIRDLLADRTRHRWAR